jgi:AraC family transcriptional regulator of adaptative response / DNA-3-methyladenine glycosylase II
MSSRDSRFDGQFITGVHSTGIYCRPSCPAMTPHAKNVSFYRTAAAAHEAGLRACKRCRPDAVPGSPEWNVRTDVVARAMRLIADGVVEREGVPGLAARLGYTPRHLTRVLVAELGAGPLALARANRAQNARTLLVSTDLSIADVAFAAGFSSIRQFNDTMAAVYESTPSALRQSRRHDVAPAPDGVSISLRLPARAPFDGAGLMRFFADHAVSGLESVVDGVFERRVRLPHGIATVRLSLDGTAPGGQAAVRCEARLESLADVSTLVTSVRRLFDLDADSVAIDQALSTDATLAPLVAALPGLRLPGSLDAEETLFRTLVGQQISVAAARTVQGRLTAELGTDGLFPTAAQIAGSEGVVRGPAARVRTILGVAEAVAGAQLSLDLGTPVREFTERLVALPGVGPWTAGYLAMRVLGSPDVLLVSDLVVLQTATRLGLPGSARALAVHGERWAPWRSYATLHLWRARDSGKGPLDRTIVG